jgi:hypothetical protein
MHPQYSTRNALNIISDVAVITLWNCIREFLFESKLRYLPSRCLSLWSTVPSGNHFITNLFKTLYNLNDESVLKKTHIKKYPETEKDTDPKWSLPSLTQTDMG